MRQWFRIVFPKRNRDRQNRAGFLFVLPAVLFFGSVFVLPLAQSVMVKFSLVGGFHGIALNGEALFR